MFKKHMKELRRWRDPKKISEWALLPYTVFHGIWKKMIITQSLTNSDSNLLLDQYLPLISINCFRNITEMNIKYEK